LILRKHQAVGFSSRFHGFPDISCNNENGVDIITSKVAVPATAKQDNKESRRSGGC